MLTGLSIRNFKCLSEADLKLADPMLLAGPNNSGKTSILQALALWHTGLRAWLDHEADRWDDIRGHIDELFGVEIEAPRYLAGRGEVAMRYRECGMWHELSSSGRGLRQTLLLLTHAYLNEGAVLLLDEPVAHLSVPRQRQTFRVINEVAEETGSQIIAASHSEALLDDAANRCTVIELADPH